jgi:xanthine dehydrogenase accessory factor
MENRRMQAWLTDLQQLLTHGDAAVLVTVARVEGSAPREAGTKMIVTRDSARHTIGGGHLEWKAIETARQVLKEGMRVPHMRRLERFALGPSLGQCCGGAVVLAFERLDVGDLGWISSLAKRVAAGLSTVRSVSFGPAPDAVMLSDPEPGVEGADCLLWDGAGFDESSSLLTETVAPRDFAVVLFGAGHVGAALVRVLGTLPCHVRWVDERDAQFPPPELLQASNVTIDPNDAPDEAIDQAAPHTYFIVMTHNHTAARRLRVLRHDRLAQQAQAVRTPARRTRHRPCADCADDMSARRGRHHRQVAGDHCDLRGRAGVAGSRSERSRNPGSMMRLRSAIPIRHGSTHPESDH